MERLTTNIVPFDGPLEAEICFLGEAPGREEDLALKPFVGAAGQLLDRCFRTVGIARGEVLMGNIFKQRPPKNKIGYYFQDAKCTKPTWEGEEHIAALKKWLEARKEEGNINVLVALGAVPTFILTGKKRITKWRGSVLPCTLVEGFKVYCCFHPSYVNRLMNEPEERLLGEKKKQQQNALPLFLRDLERVIEQSSSREFKHPEREFRIIDNAKDAIYELSYLRTESHVAVDIETLFSDEGPLHWCIGFSCRPDYAFIIPFLRNRKFFWSLPEEARVLQMISQFFLSEKTKKIFHNCLFDLSVLGRYYGLRCATGSVEDSMLCYHASYPYLKKALETLTSIYTWENYYKDDGKVWDGRRISDEAEFVYNGRDCCVTREIWPLVERDAKELGTWEGYRRTMSVIPSLLGMQIRGVNINIEKKGELQTAFGEKVVEAEELLTESTGQSWNLNSSPQMIRLVYGYLGLPMQYNHKTKKPTTDKDALNRLRRKHPENKVLKAIVDHRKFAKLSSTYAKMKVEKDHRIRTSYQFISTYRLSSSESIFGGGGNLQNIPVRTTEGKLVRSLFIPDEGFVLLASDLSQAEARVVAWLSNDTRLIEAFTAGEDVHWLNAQMIFQIPDSVNYYPKAKWRDNFTSQEHPLKFYRDLAKSIVYACVDDKTEILTIKGWKRIKDYSPQGEQIAVWEKGGGISFEIPKEFHCYSCEESLVGLSQGNYNQVVTHNHRIPHVDKYTGTLIDIEAGDFRSTRNNRKLPISGLHEWNGVSVFSSEEIRLLVAIQADLTIREGGKIEGNFKKARKIERLKEILDILSISYSGGEKETGYYSFYIPYQTITEKIIKYLGQEKLFGSWLLGLDKEAKETFMEELKWWDASRGKIEESYQYHTTVQQNAEWVATIAHLTNRRATLWVRDNNTGFGSGNNKDLWTASISKYSSADISHMEAKEVPYKGFVYCFTTSTGYFLIRRNGIISVTGNSSYGMGFNMLQTILIREEVYFQAALCKRLLHQYKANNPMLTSWQNATKEEVRATRTLVSPSPFNRKRVFRGRLSDNLFRSALAFRPQSVVGEILEVAIQKIHATSSIFTPLLNVHDEVVGQCKKEDIRESMAEAKSALETPLEINNRELTIPCDFKTGSDWGNLKEISYSNDSIIESM